MQASPSKPIKSSKLDGFRLALLLLATWRETRAYRPALRLLARRGFEQWIGTKGANIDMLAAIVAHLCDGDLAPLRDLIVTQKASIFGRLVAAAVVPQLTLRHGLAADINREFLRSLLTPTVIERLEGRQKFAIIERAAIDACHFHPVELRAELMAAVRSGIVERHVLTLKQIAETAALPAWERAQLVNEHYVRLPADVWAFLKAQQRTLSTDEDQDDEDDDEWESTLPISPNRNYGINADSGLDGTFPSGQNIRPDPASLPFGDTPSREVKKVGRNDPCPCGSGKKHKKCCGA